MVHYNKQHSSTGKKQHIPYLLFHTMSLMKVLILPKKNATCCCGFALTYMN